MSLGWISEPVPRMGAIKGEGVKRQLGRPRFDPLTVLVREAAQNSWDAAAEPRTEPVRFGIDLHNLSAEMVEEWRTTLLRGAPPSATLPLRAVLGRSDIGVLFVSDRGTTGLGGPTRADLAAEGEPHDYVSFFLNVGDPRDIEFGGGTYGYGKAVFFRSSGASTVLVHTRCTNEDGEDESRLLACALGSGFELDASTYTGRHWFGVEDEEGVEPIRNAAADELALSLGFPGFREGERGSTIAVIAPKLGEREIPDAMRVIADSVLWHLWPKMVGHDAGTRMSFEVALDGLPVEIPDPREHSALRVFVSALEELDGAGETITWGAGSMPVGEICLRTTFAPPPVIDEVGEAAGLAEGIHHCCLLRVPELVVEYRPGPAMPDEQVWYGGVFRVRPEQDTTFAEAEPPTHDSWSPEDLDARQASIVRVTLRRIDEHLRRHASPTPTVGGSEQDSVGFADVSRFLGSLLAPSPGGGADGGSGGGRNAGGSRTAVRMAGAPRWTAHEGDDVLIQDFDVSASRTVTVEAETTVIWGGGGKETAPPAGAGEPVLIGWLGPDGTLHPTGRIAIAQDEGGRWGAVVGAPADTVTRIRVREARERQDG